MWAVGWTGNLPQLFLEPNNLLPAKKPGARLQQIGEAKRGKRGTTPLVSEASVAARRGAGARLLHRVEDHFWSLVSSVGCAELNASGAD